MFRRLVERFNAVPTPKLIGACFGILISSFVFPMYVDDWVDWYILQLRQKQKVLKDTPGRRDGH